MKDELDKLAHSMAFEFAESVVRSEGLTMRDDDGEAWEQVSPEGLAGEIGFTESQLDRIYARFSIQAKTMAIQAGLLADNEG